MAWLQNPEDVLPSCTNVPLSCPMLYLQLNVGICCSLDGSPAWITLVGLCGLVLVIAVNGRNYRKWKCKWNLWWEYVRYFWDSYTLSTQGYTLSRQDYIPLDFVWNCQNFCQNWVHPRGCGWDKCYLFKWY